IRDKLVTGVQTCALPIWNRRVTEMNHHYGRRRRRGQSLAEMAVVIPVLFFVLMGGFDATVMLADRVTGGFAVRQAARLAAELGEIGRASCRERVGAAGGA